MLVGFNGPHTACDMAMPAHTAMLVESLDLPSLDLGARVTGGPLVAVVGLVGGAGASTLAYVGAG